MKKTLIGFTRAHAQNGQYAGDDFEMYGIDPGGDLVLVRMTEADAVAATITAMAEGKAFLKVDPGQIRERRPLRKAVIARRDGRPVPATVDAYLWGNYAVIAEDNDQIVIGGHDNAGFTLEAQCDRLGSGLIFARVA
jgi:hypothetical protein